ncbi:TPA: glycosyltransferase, partial [Klebsiella quasipneumoniae]|nr:glycosyltransferase [Klebsiella quasipneumoniae]
STKISKSINDSRNYNREQLRLFYPAYPRVFKNIELLIDTMHFMKIHHPVYYEKIEIILTFDRGVSLYGDNMIRKARELELNNIHFSGFVSRDKVYEMYKTEADALIFPSKLETWGLPISEAKMFNLPIIVANFDYAHETIGDYPYAIFFENEKKELAHVLISFIDGKDNFSKTKKVYSKWNQCESYDELVSHMLNA